MPIILHSNVRRSLEKIKAIDPSIAVIVITAYASEETVREGDRLQVFAIITKPFSVSHLREAVRRAVARAVRGAGLQSVSFHTSRHTFASYAVMAGVDLCTLAKLLGHRDVKMVQRYAHLAPAHLQAATNQTASAIFAADMPQKLPHAVESAASMLVLSHTISGQP